jgi:glycosyltransferase involved in cell wall biosynthesis
MEDLFSVRYEKMLKNSFDNNKQQINALGNFAQHVPSLLRNTVMKLSFLERMLLNFEKTLVWKSERTIPEEFTKCLLLNDEEAQYLAEYTTANVKVMRPNIHVPGSSSSREYNGNKTYVFLGVLNLPYNETGLIEFIEKSLPILIEKSPASKLRIIGRNPTQRIINVVKKYPHNIVLEGYVEDLSEALHSCCAMIVPLLFGSGIKIKVLEAIAHGVPIVTTSVGAMSIPLEHKFHCFIEDNLHSFPDWLIMLQDIKTNKSISDNSLLLYKSLFSKDAITESYDKLFSLNSSEQVHQ